MPRTQKRTITETEYFGIGMLVAEAEDGTYQPVGAASTIREAREIRNSDVQRRMRRADQGDDPLCPFRYVVWAQSDAGEYASVAEIQLS